MELGCATKLEALLVTLAERCENELPDIDLRVFVVSAMNEAASELQWLRKRLQQEEAIQKTSQETQNQETKNQETKTQEVQAQE